MTFDPDAVRAFEHAGWEKAAADYRATFAGATFGFIDPLLDAAGVGPCVRVLDLCCGPGVMAAAAAERGAVASGLDFSSAMLALAQKANPALRFHEGDAEAMPLQESSLDAVASNFGIHHVPRPERAVAEAFRVLRPGGLLAFTAWAPPALNTPWGLLQDAIRRHGDPDAATTPPSGGGLGSPEAVRRLLDEAGFGDISVEMVRREWRLAHPGDLIASLRRGTVRTAALIEAQRPAALLAIEAEIFGQVGAYRRDGWYCVPVVAVLARGVRPR
jgi:ubiquinone/menaquinone biosynthesis C-methylase UbiE